MTMNTDYSYCSGVTCSIRKSCKRYLPDPPDTRLQWVWPAYNPGFVDRFIEHTKAAEWGANWRINSVWHDAKECPERKRNYLAQCKNGRFNVIPDSMNWDNFYKKAEIIRWAYIEDLLPNMED